MGRDLLLRLSLADLSGQAYHQELSGAIDEWLARLSPLERQDFVLKLGAVASVCDRARVQIRGHVNPRLALESVLAQLARLA